MNSPDHVPAKFDREKFTLVATIVLTTAFVLGVLLFGVSTLGFQHRDGRHRADAEIAALSAALENYKADHSDYPRNDATALLQPNSEFNPTAYIPSSKLLYRSLSGGSKVYFEFSKSMVRQDTDGEFYVIDPYGHAYGYAYPGKKNGANFFDLWSTDGGTTAGQTNKWRGNW